MKKTAMLAALLAAATALPAMAQQPQAGPKDQAPTAASGTSGSEKVNLVIVYGNDPCPQSAGSDIVVCARKGEEERYRIPEPLRGDPNKPANQAWGERVKAMEYVGRTGTESCSATGPGGFTGCFNQLARLAKAERQAADNASWKDLVAAERARRLSTIDAESRQIEAQAVAEEKAEAAGAVPGTPSVAAQPAPAKP